MLNVKVRLKLINSLGTFTSTEIMEISEKNYLSLLEVSKSFWNTETSFSMWEGNRNIIFPPKILKKSILIIEKI